MASRRLSDVLLALLLLAPLADAPEWGFDVLRLPVALALGAAWLMAAPVSRPGPAGLALLGLLAAQLLALGASPDPSTGLAAVLVSATAVAAYLAAREREERAEVLALVAFALLAVALVQKAGGRPAASLLGNSNYAGAVAGMLLPALIARGPAGKVGAAAAALLLVLSGSRGGLLGAAAGGAATAALLWRGGRRREASILAGLLLAAGLGLLVSRPGGVGAGDTWTVRVDSWKGALRLGAERPPLGAGTGGFGAAFPPYRGEREARITQRDHKGGFPEVSDAHSSWVQAWAEGGALGLAAWLALAALTLRRVLLAGPEAAGWAGAAVAYLVAGGFNTLSAHAAPALLLGAALGALERPGGAPVPRWAALLGGSLLALGALAATSRAATERAYALAPELPTPSAREAALRERDDWRFRFRLGEELARQGRPREAAAAFRSALEKRPRHAFLINKLAMSLPREEQREAEALLERARTEAPHFFLTHFNLGLLRVEQGRRAEARKELERAAWLNESHAPSRYEIGGTYLAEGDVAAALPHLRRARELGLDVGAALRRDFPSFGGDPRMSEFRR
jgi:tetratricopeptide (TPR) repeat protein